MTFPMVQSATPITKPDADEFGMCLHLGGNRTTAILPLAFVVIFFRFLARSLERAGGNVIPRLERIEQHDPR